MGFPSLFQPLPLFKPFGVPQAQRSPYSVNRAPLHQALSVNVNNHYGPPNRLLSDQSAKLHHLSKHIRTVTAKSLQSCLTLCDPIDGSPPGSPHPWDSPGKNTGVGCHFLLQCMKVKSESEVAQSCPTPRDPMDCSPPGSSVHGIRQARVLEWGAVAFTVTVTKLVFSQKPRIHIHINCSLELFKVLFALLFH